MLRELVMHEKIYEIPGYMNIMPESKTIMTRKEMNDFIDEIFAAAKKSEEEES